MPAPDYKQVLITGVVLLFSATLVNSQNIGKNQQAKVQSRQLDSSRYEVTCFESAEYCAEEFKRLCPNGHQMGGYFRNEYDHGQITVIISCRESH
jgi:hypothetical protein